VPICVDGAGAAVVVRRERYGARFRTVASGRTVRIAGISDG
jgi:hypothetical protein